jgi:ATP-binding cassette subfamily E protein 1
MESDETVYSVVSRAIERYENVLIKPLGIQHLYEKTLSQLSGGELQRVSIVAALAQDAELYLLDEPSAYLDVEQRILLSKIIAEFIEYNEKTAVIIDHDLLFIDYLSQRIMIFDGVPSKHGHMRGIRTMEEGMNEFLQDLGITFRRDHESYRPRANKTDSQMDRKQKTEKRYYYTS